LALRLAKRNKSKDPETSPHFYEEFFDTGHLDQYEQDLRVILRHEEILRVVRRLPASCTCLDVGCGVGHVLRILPSSFKRFGVDYSRTSLSLVRRRLGRDTLLIQGSVMSLPFADATFDLVTCFEVLEHVQDDEGAMEEIARVLKAGGTVLVSVPSEYYFDEYKALMGHYRHYTPQSLAELLGRTGIEVVEYLNPYRRFNRLHFYAYLAMAGTNVLLNRIMRTNRTLYSRTLPLSSRKVYSGFLAPMLYKLRVLDEDRHGEEEASTFVVGRLMRRRGV
jgi:ubiquinone/menaquinone biosynthesis C-methylase UbiE